MSRIRVLELFCGIGGCAAAVAARADVVAAIDIDRRALDVYQHNFAHRSLARTIESLTASELAAFQADLWWLSPPCQPYTTRGKQRDLTDPRAASLVALIERIEQVRPRYIALENVAPFASSHARQRLLESLGRAGYACAEGTVCPSELGWPNRRPRYYLLAEQSPRSLYQGLRAAVDRQEQNASPTAIALAGSIRAQLDTLIPGPTRVQNLLDPSPCLSLRLDCDFLRRYGQAIHVVAVEDPAAVTRCFTSAYGRSPVHCGSYLREAGDAGFIRRFSPHEILRLLGFPPDYALPPDLSTRHAWSLVGNSLSVPIVQLLLTPWLTPAQAARDMGHC